ncbi:MAG: hypothetical protein ATN31_08775 [Candidatus Epulonipiscioides saccharophilum]|nr:MAG: hypothetical protein ATN31_08775 [Epulopiscium sp. AS2M-Bin001]
MTRVYYFSRTGDCETIAKSIAEQTQGSISRLTDNQDWSGMAGFLKGGAASLKRMIVDVNFEVPIPNNDTIYLCFPVWAGTFPPAVRIFIEKVGRENIILVPKSLRSRLKETEGFKQIIEIVGKTTDIKV